MKRLIFCLIIIMTFTTCGLYKHATNNWETIGTDGAMFEIYNQNIDSTTLVMLCQQDTLSSDLSDWLKMGFHTFDGKIMEQWLYIKDTNQNTTYVLTKQNDSTYNLSIRTIINKIE